MTVANEGSADLVYARRLTDELGVPLDIVPAPEPEELLKELDAMVARLETWESQVLTHAFPTWAALSALATLPGRSRTVLTGEGSDELFGGYRSGTESPADVLRHRLRELGNLHRTSCQRLDRLAAATAIEVRTPFLAPEVIRAALGFGPQDLVRNGLSKAALRAAMRDDLPDYVLEREKMTFARGAGYHYGRQDAGHGLLGEGFDRDAVVPPDWDDTVSRLATGPLERYTLARFLQLGYGKASYLLSRTL
ncbi:asparagine synthase C-terminal domain-containing protein [Streptomyces sp. NPDC020379]|uniref:asparagine synthase C-terminal domain-containing protein n=1 Tax=Streptomyces sp. NPDC020379 TaxID=3365071 RepID=UPI0037AAEB0E